MGDGKKDWYDAEDAKQAFIRRAWNEFGVTLTKAEFAHVKQMAEKGKKLEWKWSSKRTLEQIVNDTPDLGLKWETDEHGQFYTLSRMDAQVVYEPAASYLRKALDNALLLNKVVTQELFYLEKILLKIATEINDYSRHADKVKKRALELSRQSPYSRERLPANGDFYVGRPNVLI